MLLKRHQDIIAIQAPGFSPVAFHSRSMEVAGITSELWNILEDTSLTKAEPVQIPHDLHNEAAVEMRTWESSENPEAQTRSWNGRVQSITFNVTQVCNLHCTYCAAGGDGTFGDAVARISIEKTLPQLKYFIEKLPSQSRFHLSFLGGEPLLYPEAIEAIVMYAREIATPLDIEITCKVTTNGTLMSQKVLDMLKKTRMWVIVSMDGPPDIHDRVRPQKNGKSSSRMVIDGLRSLLTIKDDLANLQIHGVFTAQNMNVVEAYKFFREFPVDAYEFTYGVNDHDPKLNTEFMQQMSQIAAMAYSIGGETELRRIENFDHYFRLLDRQERLENHCGAGKSFLMVDSRNQIYTCPWVVGRKNEKVGQDTTLESDKLGLLSRPLIELNDCGNCWARHLCGGGCMFIHESKTGNKHQKDQNFCERTRYLIGLTLLYYEKSRSTLE